jgi:hypothetical protein
MKPGNALIALVTVLLFASLLTSVHCDAPLIDHTVTVTLFGNGYDAYANLTAGDRVSISISVEGDPTYFGIYNSTPNATHLFARDNVTSLNEEWTAPYRDQFDFYVTTEVIASTVHLVIQKLAPGQHVGGGGVDPLPIVVAVVAILVVLISAFLILRLRKKTPPPPPSDGQLPPPP